MDEADRAQMEEERSLQAALQSRRKAGPAATGFCLYCYEVVDGAMRWCSIECRDDWTAEVDRR